SPRLAARDGMEQEPYEFRIRPAKPESKGKATEHPQTRLACFTEKQFARGHFDRVARRLFRAAEIHEILWWESTWAAKQITGRRHRRVTNTTRSPSRFSAASRLSACAPRCTSARRGTWVCTTSFGRCWTTPLTRRWPASRMKSTSPCTPTTP